MKKQSHSFIFPLFTMTSAGLVIVFWWLPQLVPWLASPWLGGVGAVAVLAVGWLGWTRRLPPRRVYDLLLWGTLWLWLAYWLQVFPPEAPLFKAYPIYFVILDVLSDYFIFSQSERWNTEEHQLLEILTQQWWFSEKLWAGVVLVSLLMTRHYLIYPLAVGLLSIRRALEQVLWED